MRGTYIYFATILKYSLPVCLNYSQVYASRSFCFVDSKCLIYPVTDCLVWVIKNCKEPASGQASLTHSNSNIQNISISLHGLLESLQPQGNGKRVREHLQVKWVALPEGKLQLRKPKYFIMGSRGMTLLCLVYKLTLCVINKDRLRCSKTGNPGRYQVLKGFQLA